MLKKQQEKRIKRCRRIRAKLKSRTNLPRLSVFRSSRHIYGQLIDDKKGKTILSSSELELKKSKIQKTGKIAIAFAVGKLIAEKAKEKKISEVVFDRGRYRYHGRVKALADGAREGGLLF